MTSSNVTNLNDAKVMRKLRLPLNTPLPHRDLSSDFIKHWSGLMNAQTRFEAAISKFFGDGPQAWSDGQWNRVRQRLADLSEGIEHGDRFVRKLGGCVNPPTLARDQDKHELGFLSAFLMHRAIPFFEFWEGVINTIDDGTMISINEAELPRWIDEHDFEAA